MREREQERQRERARERERERERDSREIKGKLRDIIPTNCYGIARQDSVPIHDTPNTPAMCTVERTRTEFGRSWSRPNGERSSFFPSVFFWCILLYCSFVCFILCLVLERSGRPDNNTNMHYLQSEVNCRNELKNRIV